MNIRRAVPVALATTVLLLASVGVGLVFADHRTVADLAVTKTDSLDPVATGEQLTYTVTVVNNGPDTSITARLDDTLPAGTVFVSATPGQGTCPYDLATHTVNCALGNLSNGASVSVTIVVTAGAPGTISNTAIAYSPISGDPNSANNSDTETTVVAGPSADLAITKADAPDPVVTGQQVTYTLTARNNGPDAVGGVRIEDSLSASGATFVSATASQGTCTHSTATNLVSCAVGTMASGATVTATIIVTSGAPGTSTNTAAIDSNAAAWTDSALGNNTASTRTTVVAASTPTAAPTPTPAPSAGLLPDTTAAPADAGPAGSLALLMVGSTILLAGAWRLSARRRASRSG